MDKVSNIVTDENDKITTFRYNTDDPVIVNMFKRALNFIPTYAIEYVIFNRNTSARHSEILAFKMGQLPIDNIKFIQQAVKDLELKDPIDFEGSLDLEELNNYKVPFNVKGPKIFTSDDIPLPFAYNSIPILELKDDHEINGYVIVKRGIGRTHVKWRPTSIIIPTKLDHGYKIKIESVGMLPGAKIIELAIKHIPDAENEGSDSIYYRPIVRK